jgi:TolB-like protein/tetratricopeptide (TPR) repeat protein
MRQLAAILFADMTGFTALMQENEQLARSKRKRLKEVLETTIEKFNGKILQYYGDGSLTIFNSAIDSVRCAIGIQQQLQMEPKVDLRIGIHTGDVIIEDETIYGDGVNLASRIESLAVPGGIFISEKLQDEIKNQDDIITREIGYFELKNVKFPIKIFAIANPGIIVPGRDEIKGNRKKNTNRLAVLPFVNMSADPDNEYFSDGITEELLNALTRVEGLQVTSRTSAFAFKGKNHDIRDIAIQLNVDKVLEGSVRKSGNRVRITAQLISAADGYHIWSESYDRDLTDIFDVQDEISGIITNKLRENLAPAEKTNHLVKAPTRNVTAYTLYLKGLHYSNKLTPADTRKAIECFEQAIAIEPNYAQAYSLAAGNYASLGSSGQLLPNKAFEIVHKYADIALKLDDTIAESHIAKATAYLLYDWEWEKAYASLERALTLNRGAVEAYELLAFYHVIMGDKQKAIQLLEEAQELDPLSATIVQALGNTYVFAERYADAIRQADKLLEMNPQMRISIEMKGWAYGMQGDWKASIPYFEEVHRLTNHPLKGVMGLGFAYGKLGEKEKAMEVIEKMEKRQKLEPESVIDADLAAVWWGMGEKEKTFYYINQCIDKRMGPVCYFLEYPAFYGIKDDPRYNEVRKKMKLK